MKLVALVLALRDTVVFPGSLRPVLVGRPASVAAVEHHLAHHTPLVAIPQVDPAVEDLAQVAFTKVGVLVEVLRVARTPDGTLQLLVQGIDRVAVDAAPAPSEQGPTVSVRPIVPSGKAPPPEWVALGNHLVRHYVRFAVASGLAPDEREPPFLSTEDPERIADELSAKLELSWANQLELLETPGVKDRLDQLHRHLLVALAQQQLESGIEGLVQQAMDDSQRSYHLKEQLRAIRQELGESDPVSSEFDQLADRVREAGMPSHALQDALRELDRLRRMHIESGEYALLRTWLETLCELPWSKSTTDATDLRAAKQALDRDHYGLDEVKERCIEYLAVRQLNADSKGPILCFVGPPGVGKTSLGRSIATALGRAFARIALGGVKDESEIRGHRRTYIGALPGRIVRSLIRVQSSNPVLLFDEIDKVGSDARGDPASALLEVLDPEQNNAFVDRYVDTPVDLSQVLFVATANRTDTIPDALLDRLEIITIPGYTQEEKIQISKRFLLPKQAANNGLAASQLKLSVPTIQAIIRDYTREAGVRGIERMLAKIHRKVARQVVEGRTRPTRVLPGSLRRYLGPVRFRPALAEPIDQPGVVIGLAWTPTGGDLLFVEATRMTGKHRLTLTGSLGNVMKESVKTAMSWLRTNAGRYPIADDFFDAGFHLHVPAGAIPKDGPSAGVTMVVALASLAVNRTVSPRIAMTGEITLRGKVLPVGGLKEKVLAARSAGIRRVIVPADNQSDLQKLKPELRRDLRFDWVHTIHQVLDLTLFGESLQQDSK